MINAAAIFAAPQFARQWPSRRLADVRKLKSLLPICMYCKSVRDDQDYWRQIDEYIYTETGTDFSHGICPACLEKITKGQLM